MTTSSEDLFRVVRSDNRDIERLQLNKILRRLADSAAQVQTGTVTGQLARWNNTAARYEPVTLNTLADAADDAAATTAGVAVGGLYRTGSILKTRAT